MKSIGVGAAETVGSAGPDIVVPSTSELSYALGTSLF